MSDIPEPTVSFGQAEDPQHSKGATGRDPKTGHFLKGWQGGSRGRPKGSRVKLSEKFFAALHDDFEEHGVAAIARMRFQDPSAYVSMIAKLMPQKLEVEHTVVGSMSDEDLERMIELADRMIADTGVIEGEVRDVTPTLAPPLDEVLATAAQQRAEPTRKDLNYQHDALGPSTPVLPSPALPYPAGRAVPLADTLIERRNIAKLHDSDVDPESLF